MRAIRSFWVRFISLFQADRRENELDEEIAYHLERRIEDGVRSGLTREEARRVARIESGGLDLAKEAWRERRGLPLLENLFRDTRFALRTLRRNPGFSVIALLTLGLGIGANTAIFSLVDAFLLKPLPVKDPQELVLVRGAFPYSTFEVFRDRNRSFAGIFAYDQSHLTLVVDGHTEYLDADLVSGSYFEVLGINALMGRTFRTEDDAPGSPAVAVISYRYWVQRFHRELSAVGKTVYLADIPCTIVGVAPRQFLGTVTAGKSADIVVPMFLHSRLALKDHDSVAVMGRLKSGVSIESARSDLDLIYRQILTAKSSDLNNPNVQRELRNRRVELRQGVRGTSSTNGTFAMELRILEAVAGLALLIACVNVSNLLLARTAGRQREIALRLSIGAGRKQLIRQLLTESTVLALGGGLIGLAFAMVGPGLLVAVLSYGRGPIPFDPSADLRILLFTAAISLLTGVLFGLAPALTAARANPAPILKGSESATGDHEPRLSATSLFVVIQVALSLVLLIGSGLMIRTLQTLYQVDFGFEREKVVTA